MFFWILLLALSLAPRGSEGLSSQKANEETNSLEERITNVPAGDTIVILSLSPVLLKFRTDKGRDPLPESYAEDSELLLQIRNEVLDSLGVSADLLPVDFVRCACSAEVRCRGWDQDSRLLLASGAQHAVGSPPSGRVPSRGWGAVIHAGCSLLPTRKQE